MSIQEATQRAAGREITSTAPGERRDLDLGELIARRRPGRSLESPFYTSPAIHDVDVDVIFGRHWIFVAAAAQIPEPGDYVTMTIGRYSVLLVRDDEEEVRAFHNVCRHRGARLFTDVCGSVGNIVCPYHHWTYGVDGRFLHAETPPVNLDREASGLKPVHVRDIAGLIFVCLAEEAPSDIDKMAATITPYLLRHRLDRAKVATSIDIVEEGNWKLVMENNRECYHCDGHPELLSCYFPLFEYTEEEITARLRPMYERFRAATADLESTCERLSVPMALQQDQVAVPTGYRIERAPLDRGGASFSTDGNALSRVLLGDFDTACMGDLSLHTQPNAWFHFLADHAVVFSVVPLATDRTLLRTIWLVHQDAIEGEDYELDALTMVWRATNSQDSHFVARTQAGVNSPAYEPGPYSPTEVAVDDFVSWYIGRLRAHGVGQ